MFGPAVIYGPALPTEDNHYWSTERKPGDARWVRTNRGYVKRHPEAEVRWLEPRCSTCAKWAIPEREWCDHDAWGDCTFVGRDVCTVQAQPYRREDVPA